MATRQARKVAADLQLASTAPADELPGPGHGRPVYPYSVIRGGAYSGGELVRSLDADPVAARHYAVFQRSLVHLTESRFAQPVYLSYRVGNIVYWTSRPVRVPRGEPLLTDGTHYARARCGNRISPAPQTPVNDTEPGPSTLDQPKPPADLGTPGLDTWAETRLVTELSPPFALLAPANTPPTAFVPGTGGLPLSSSAPTWLLTGLPSGFLPTGEGTPLTPYVPSSTNITGEVIQPNPIPGLILPTQPVSGFPFYSVTPEGPTTVPGGYSPVAVVPPVFVPPGYVPPEQVVPSWWFPVQPIVPSGPDIPVYPPDVPAPEVPEPGLLLPTILAALALVAAARRNARHTISQRALPKVH